MDSMKYDYYGNYEDDNDNSFTFSVSDIHKKQFSEFIVKSQ